MAVHLSAKRFIHRDNSYQLYDQTVNHLKVEQQNNQCFSLESKPTFSRYHIRTKSHCDYKINRGHSNISQISQNTKLSVKYFNNYCSIISCNSISNIIESLVWYQNLNENSNKLLQYSYRLLLDDFHHILNHHLSIYNKTINEIQKEYQLIYNQIAAHIYCDINKCLAYKRHSGDRHFDDEKSNIIYDNDAQIAFFIDTLDSIHCYFLHSFDTANRINILHDNNQKYQIHDLQIKRIKAIIHKLNISKTNWRNNMQSKFFTKLADKIQKTATFRSGLYSSNTAALSDSFGFKYYYHSYYRDSNETKNWYISKKYLNLKDEIINNAIYCLNINVVNNITIKATKICKCNYSKQLAVTDNEMTEYFKIKTNSSVTPQHLMSIILFCDYYDLTFYFKSTFIKLNSNETNQQIKIRHREFYHFAKLLTETVQLFGKKISSNKTQVFYHGVTKCKFESFSMNFNGPTSMTSMIEVAVKSFVDISDMNGMLLLELRGENEFCYLKSFDCSWLSSNGNENEHIFFGQSQRGNKSKLKLNNIRMLHTNENYYIFMKALNLFFNFVLTAKELTQLNVSEISETDYMIIHSLLKHIDCYNKYENNKIPKYIRSLFKNLCFQQKMVEISLEMINNTYYGLRKYLINDKCNNLVNIDYISRLFTHLKEITIYNVNNMNYFYIQSLMEMFENMEGVCNNLIRLTLRNVQYNYQYLDARFLAMYSMQFQLKCACKVTIDIKDRLIYDEENKLYITFIEQTDLIIIRNPTLHKRMHKTTTI